MINYCNKLVVSALICGQVTDKHKVIKQKTDSSVFSIDYRILSKNIFILRQKYSH